MPEATQLGKSHSWGDQDWRPGHRQSLWSGPAVWVQSRAFIRYTASPSPPSPAPWECICLGSGWEMWSGVPGARHCQGGFARQLFDAHPHGHSPCPSRGTSAMVRGPGWGLTGLGATPALPLAQDPRTIVSRACSTLGGVPRALRSDQPCYSHSHSHSHSRFTEGETGVWQPSSVPQLVYSGARARAQTVRFWTPHS